MPIPLGSALWIVGLLVLLVALLSFAARRFRANRRLANSDAPVVRYFADGIPELDVPPGAIVAWWRTEGRYAFYVERPDTDGRRMLNLLRFRRRSGSRRADQLLGVLMAEAPQDPPTPPPSPTAGTGRSWLRLVRVEPPRRQAP